MTDIGPVCASQADLAASSEGLADHGVFEATVRKTRMATAIVDPNLPDQPVVYINGAFTKLTRDEVKSAIGRNSRFLKGADINRESVLRIRRAISEPRQIAEELYNYQRDGSGFCNALFFSPIFGENGKLAYLFASQADVGLCCEMSPRQVRRTDNFSALISGVAHQFNNLMTVVLGSVEQAFIMTLARGSLRHLQRATWAPGAPRRSSRNYLPWPPVNPLKTRWSSWVRWCGSSPATLKIPCCEEFYLNPKSSRCRRRFVWTATSCLAPWVH